MGPKKKAAVKEGDEEDKSVDNFMKYYKKNCAAMGCDVNKAIKQKFDEEYLEEG